MKTPVNSSIEHQVEERELSDYWLANNNKDIGKVKVRSAKIRKEGIFANNATKVRVSNNNLQDKVEIAQNNGTETNDVALSRSFYVTKLRYLYPCLLNKC